MKSLVEWRYFDRENTETTPFRSTRFSLLALDPQQKNCRPVEADAVPSGRTEFYRVSSLAKAASNVRRGMRTMFFFIFFLFWRVPVCRRLIRFRWKRLGWLFFRFLSRLLFGNIFFFCCCCWNREKVVVIFLSQLLRSPFAGEQAATRRDGSRISTNQRSPFLLFSLPFKSSHSSPRRLRFRLVHYIRKSSFWPFGQRTKSWKTNLFQIDGVDRSRLSSVSLSARSVTRVD